MNTSSSSPAHHNPEPSETPRVDAMSDDVYMQDTSRTLEGRLGSIRPRPHKVWRTKYVKLMVVGDSGLGKTTLINTLMAIPGEKMKLHDGSETSAAQFCSNPSSLCTTISWNDEEDRTTWVYRIQDTPGYGDDLNVMNNITLMTDFIEKQNSIWLNKELSHKRGLDPSQMDDPRVDLCLFCLPPHRIRPIDVRFMYELAKVVPILPVVTKADTMTIQEAEHYRAEVYDRLRCPNLAGITQPINTFSFSEDSLGRASLPKEIRRHIPPFLVVASNQLNEERLRGTTPVLWPERVYPWGTSEAFNDRHSDLLYLRALLLQEALEEISEAKKLRYESWRSRVMSKRRVRPMRFLRRTLLTCAVLSYGAWLMSRRAGVDLVKIASVVQESVKEQRQAAKENDAEAAEEGEEAEPPVPEPVKEKKRGFWQV